MLMLKACPRCHGDLVLEYDRHAGYLACVQCGHTLSAVQERALGVQVSRHGLAHLRPAPPRTPVPLERLVAVPAGR